LSDYTLISGSASCYTCASDYKSSVVLLTSTDPHSNSATALGDGVNGAGLARITDYDTNKKIWCYKDVD
jgi:hypothetical protein